MSAVPAPLRARLARLRAFSLVELLVVLVILAVVASILWVGSSVLQTRADERSVLETASSIERELDAAATTGRTSQADVLGGGGIDLPAGAAEAPDGIVTVNASSGERHACVHPADRAGERGEVTLADPGLACDEAHLTVVYDPEEDVDDFELPLQERTGPVTVYWDDTEVVYDEGDTVTPPDGGTLSAGEHVITARGAFTGFGWPEEPVWPAVSTHLTDVREWGGPAFASLSYAFYGVSDDLGSVPSNLPATVTNLEGAFTSSSHVPDEVADWDTGNITTFERLFYYSSIAETWPAGEGVEQWDTSSVENFYRTFRYSNFDGDLSAWDTSSATTMGSMFQGSAFSGFGGDISGWDVTNVTDFEWMFLATDFELERRDGEPSDAHLFDWCVAHVPERPDGFSGYGGAAWWEPNWGEPCDP